MRETEHRAARAWRFLLALTVVLRLLDATGAWGDPQGASADPSSLRPNIILVLTDDLDSASMQMLPGFKALLADQGVTFSRFFVSDSLCCPSRASILCGQYNHNHGVRTNGPPDGGYERFSELGRESETVARSLHDVG